MLSRVLIGQDATFGLYMFPPVRFLISINRNEFKQNALCKAISDVHVRLGSFNGQTGGFDYIESYPMISLCKQIVSKEICRNCYPHTVRGVTLPGSILVDHRTAHKSGMD